MASGSSSVCRPHVLMLPFPETGHINPLMDLAKYLSSCHGFLITFVNTLYNHKRILRANVGHLPSDHGLDIRMVGIPDGLSEVENRDNDVADFVKVIENVGAVLDELIRNIASECPHPVTCIISDVTAVKTIDVAQKFGIPRVAFWPPNASTHSLICHARHAASVGEFAAEDFLEKDEVVSFPGLPPMRGRHLPWAVGTKQEAQSIFKSVCRNVEALRHSEWVLCNSVYELEPTIQSLLPSGYSKVCPIGPILHADLLQKRITRENQTTTGLWTEQNECLDWLDHQSPCTVLYVSMGSIVLFVKQQLLELALGLEASGVRILWVLRADTCSPDCFPDGYIERNAKKMKIVQWCPQVSVLSHKAVGGFLTHCGWNSTLEAMAMGIPMLAWPHLADQFLNSSLIVDEWGVGIHLGEGFVRGETVEAKVKELMSQESPVRGKALQLKQVITRASIEGGSSFTNLVKFVEWLKMNCESFISIARKE
ncbi:hypothetical protein KP509_15G052300 [Ceratopteris richardii]|uniref:Glycosyltransferase n=1 Tax=Ceratopteris richardii TaxID=49495 RepID=A0A8T2T707_CERRI|nr:hypothetical protein KP509_15G052300 [Ceratopteris richardii]